MALCHARRTVNSGGMAVSGALLGDDTPEELETALGRHHLPVSPGLLSSAAYFWKILRVWGANELGKQNLPFSALPEDWAPVRGRRCGAA